MIRQFNLLLSIGFALAVWFWPDLPLSALQQRTLGIFALAGLLWVLEPVPVHATSMLILSLLLVLVSNQSPWATADSPAYTEVLASLASPVVILFLGGFALAVAAARTGVDRLVAVRLLRPFGRDPGRLLWGIVAITALLSMFLSNTATTILMLSMLGTLSAGQALPRIVVLAVPVAANLGGMGTPIGTPPNAIALQYLSDAGLRVSFAQWMLIGLPIVAALLALAVFMLRRRCRGDAFEIALPDEVPRLDRKGHIVLATLALTIALWLTGDWHGVNAYVVATLPLTLLPLAGLLGKEELRCFDWDVIWLVAGGIALGRAMEGTGLAAALVGLALPEGLPLVATALLLMLAAWLLANFMSNTATANLLLPLAAVMGGSTPWVLVVVALATSLGMMLPISTPPNALAYATGRISNRDLLGQGAVIGAAGLLAVSLWALPLSNWLLR